MRFAIVFLLLSACAKAKQDPLIATLESERSFCQINNSKELPPLYTVVYPDGVYRKSEMQTCTGGCVRYLYVNDPTINITVCGGN